MAARQGFWERLLYGPSEWIVANTTARLRLAVATWVTIFWIGPGFILWLFLLHALWYVGLMSIVALWLTAITMIGAESPVRVEGDDSG